MSLTLRLRGDALGYSRHSTTSYLFSQLGQCAAQARRSVLPGEIISEGEVVAYVSPRGVITDLDHQEVRL